MSGGGGRRLLGLGVIGGAAARGEGGGMVGLVAAAGVALGDPPADYASIAAVGLFVALMCVCIIVGHLLEENRWVNESITALFIVSSRARHLPPCGFCGEFRLIVCCVPCSWIAGARDGSSHPLRVEREALARAGVQRRSLLHIPAAPDHI